MKLRTLLGRLDRVQRARWFKIAASVAVVLLIAAGVTWYAIGVENGSFGGSAALLNEIENNANLAPDAPRFVFLRGVLEDSAITASAGIGALLLTGVAVIVIWLGLGLTYLALLLAAALSAGPMMFFGPTEVYGRLLLGVIILSAACTALMQGGRVLLGGPGAVAA